MTSAVTPEGDRAIADIARRHGLSREAVLSMAVAVQHGAGTMAQFSIPELGGSGQWMRGGMTMVGDMFDHSLKARVDALCNELAQLVGTTTVFPPTRSWWPDDLGIPSSTGGQNDTRYAVFPGSRRLAIHQHGATRVFDTGEHRIGGVQQQQGGPSGVVTFTSQLGTFDVASLREIGAAPAPSEPAPSEPAPSEPAAQAPAPAPAPAPAGDPASVIAAIESLAGLHERGILSDDEFAAKKAELLARI